MLPWLQDGGAAGAGGVAGGTSLAKRVRDEMLGLILRGEYAPGQRINEPDIAARMQVSRVPVREALRELEGSGLVAGRRHAGVFVRVLQPAEVAELYELRSIFDGHAAARAAGLPAPARGRLVSRLSACMAQMAAHVRVHDTQAYYSGNLRFHWTLVAAVGNLQMERSYRDIVQQLHLSRLTNLSREPGMEASVAEHAAIVRALAAGDAARCRALASDHVADAHRRLGLQARGPAPRR